MGAAEATLAVNGLEAGYGSNKVLHGVTFDVREGEAVAMVGLNGAGKSVCLRCVCGLLRPWAGTVTMGGRDVTSLIPEKRVAMGMGTVPQGRGIFPDLTVEQNLRMGGYHLGDREYGLRVAEVVERFPRLDERKRQAAGTLSGGEQAMLAVARALVGRPKLLLLDEPTAGLAPAVAKEMIDMLGQLNREGVTMLLVEQNIGLALKLVSRVLLMQKGLIVRTASPDSLTDRKSLLEELGAGALYAEPAAKAPAAPRA